MTSSRKRPNKLITDIKENTSPNKKVHRYSKKKHTKMPGKHYYIFGIHPLEEAIQRGTKFHRLYLQKLEEKNFEIMIQYCKKHKINFFFVDKKELDEKSQGGNHQGVVAELLRDTRIIPDLKEYLNRQINDCHNGEVILILDRITDQQNLGAIARSAYFFGCRLIISERSHSAPIDAVVHKTSSGASLMVNFYLAEKITNAVEILKENNYEILAATSRETISLNQLNKNNYSKTTEIKKYAVILGSEGKGIRPHLERLADQRITIPRLNNFDSLNVSVATGIILYAMSESRIISLPKS